MDISGLLLKALGAGASDLLIKADTPPFTRKNGQVTPMGEPPFTEEAIGRFREHVLEDDVQEEYRETGSACVGWDLGNGSRCRLAFAREQGLSSVSARLFSLKEPVELPPETKSFLTAGRGLILVAGEAGSGKTTTLHAMVETINQTQSKHILTLENPLELLSQSGKSLVSHRDLELDVEGLGSALRAALSEGPDVIVIGHLAGMEAIQLALSAAQAGHLVIAGVPVPNTIAAIQYLIDSFPEDIQKQTARLLAQSLVGVTAQKLVLNKAGNGQLAAFEVLKSTPLVNNLIAEMNLKDVADVVRHAHEEGMQSLTRALAVLCQDGKITEQVAEVAAESADEFQMALQALTSGTGEVCDSVCLDEGDDSELCMKRLLHAAVGNGASDLLLTVGSRPTLRCEGALKSLKADPLQPVDTKRLLYSMMSARQRGEFETNREIDFALTAGIKRSHEDTGAPPSPHRFRVNGFYQRGNVAISLRVIPDEIPEAVRLGIPQSVLQMADKKQGLILVTGPTGHGKSTTLASLIDRINKNRACHIITVEDPIEYVHLNQQSVIEQREVHTDTLSFSNALKYVLRQDPDVILVGEMRDPETIAAALTAAETGHLVMATLHTNSAPQSIDRIIDSFPEGQQEQIRLQLSTTLLGVVSQRLLERNDGKGRIAAFEVMVGTIGVQNLIRSKKTYMIKSEMETGARSGMITLDKSLQEIYSRGLITKDDMLSLMKTTQDGGK